jgi:hypothetical protein
MWREDRKSPTHRAWQQVYTQNLRGALEV